MAVPPVLADLVSAPNAPNRSGRGGRDRRSKFYELSDNLGSRSPNAGSSTVRLCSLASSSRRLVLSGLFGMRVSLASIVWRCSELWERRGTAGPVALCVVDSNPAKLLQSGLILDTFGDRLDLELARDTDDRLDDLPVFLVAEQISHELHVDLEIVDRQVPEIGEAPVADTEVIQRKRATQLAQTHREAPRRIEVIGHGGLGDLKHKVLRRRSAGKDRPLDPVNLRWVRDRLG